MTIKSLLMVCRGNICRSPMAEAFFADQLARHHSPVVVSSAGITALSNHAADHNAQQIMQKNGIDLSKHQGRQLSLDLVKQSDLILVMTHSHLDILNRQFLTAKGKTFLLGHWQANEIPDPYQKDISEFAKVYEQIKLAWQHWKTRILGC